MTAKRSSWIALADPLWTVPQVAEATGIPVARVRQAVHATARGPWLPPLEPAFRKGGSNGAFMIRRSEVRRWVREIKEQAATAM